MNLTHSFQNLLENFAPVFTAPSFQTFRLLMTGWIVSMRHRYVTDLIISSDCVYFGHFSDYHRFFSQASWNIDQLWELLAKLVVRTLVGKDATIILAGDDTLCRKRGLGIFGTGMHHDALSSSKSKKLFHWGHDWVDLCLVIEKPWWASTKVFALPICMRLYRNKQGLVKGKNKVKSKPGPGQRKAASKESQTSRASQEKRCCESQTSSQKDKIPHKTRPELMAEMIAMVAAWFPDRKFILVVDSLYSGKSVLRNLPENFDLIGPVHARGALYEPATEQPKGRGRRRTKGERLSSAKEWEKDRTSWKTHHFDQYGLHGSLRVKTRTGLYYTGWQRSSAAFRAVAGYCWRKANANFLQHRPKSFDAPDSFQFLIAMVDRSDALRLQATPGNGRSSQPSSQSSRTNCANVDVSLQPNHRLVCDPRSYRFAVPRATVVHSEKGTELPRHV